MGNLKGLLDYFISDKQAYSTCLSFSSESAEFLFLDNCDNYCGEFRLPMRDAFKPLIPGDHFYCYIEGDALIMDAHSEMGISIARLILPLDSK